MKKTLAMAGLFALTAAGLAGALSLLEGQAEAKRIDCSIVLCKGAGLRGGHPAGDPARRLLLHLRARRRRQVGREHPAVQWPRGAVQFDFLLCSERSGSNLITQILDSHSEVSGPFPSHLLLRVGRHVARYGDLRDDASWRALVTDVVDYPERDAQHVGGRASCRGAPRRPAQLRGLVSCRLPAGGRRGRQAPRVREGQPRLHVLRSDRGAVRRAPVPLDGARPAGHGLDLEGERHGGRRGRSGRADLASRSGRVPRGVRPPAWHGADPRAALRGSARGPRGDGHRGVRLPRAELGTRDAGLPRQASAAHERRQPLLVDPPARSDRSEPGRRAPASICPTTRCATSRPSATSSWTGSATTAPSTPWPTRRSWSRACRARAARCPPTRARSRCSRAGAPCGIESPVDLCHQHTAGCDRRRLRRGSPTC